MAIKVYLDFFLISPVCAFILLILNEIFLG